MDTLVEFRAGRMQLQEGQLRADPRKGLLRVAQVRIKGFVCYKQGSCAFANTL
jgi:hypothetical protein